MSLVHRIVLTFYYSLSPRYTYSAHSPFSWLSLFILLGHSIALLFPLSIQMNSEIFGSGNSIKLWPFVTFVAASLLQDFKTVRKNDLPCHSFTVAYSRVRLLVLNARTTEQSNRLKISLWKLQGCVHWDFNRFTVQFACRQISFLHFSESIRYFFSNCEGQESDASDFELTGRSSATSDRLNDFFVANRKSRKRERSFRWLGSGLDISLGAGARLFSSFLRLVSSLDHTRV